MVFVCVGLDSGLFEHKLAFKIHDFYQGFVFRLNQKTQTQSIPNFFLKPNTVYLPVLMLYLEHSQSIMEHKSA